MMSWWNRPLKKAHKQLAMQASWAISLFLVFCVPPVLGAKLAQARHEEKKLKLTAEKDAFHRTMAEAIVARQADLRAGRGEGGGSQR
mmetsp:Transcript_36727/g.115032  ORF Transcript_36727/g.115032 Transcript_36727/m.115032 type:complete len:87 (-) Transcript_36727:425-685(-)